MLEVEELISSHQWSFAFITKWPFLSVLTSSLDKVYTFIFTNKEGLIYFIFFFFPVKFCTRIAFFQIDFFFLIFMFW